MVDYYLECISCHEKFFDTPHNNPELDFEEVYEALDPVFFLHDFSIKNLIKWLNKHKDHGGIRFQIS